MPDDLAQRCCCAYHHRIAKRYNICFSDGYIRGLEGRWWVWQRRGYGNGSRLMLVHDMSFVHQRSTDTKWYIFYLFVGLAGVISAVTVIVAQLSWRGWVAGVRDMLTKTGLPAEASQAHSAELHPVAQDLHALVRELEADRRMRDESQITWSPASLKPLPTPTIWPILASRLTLEKKPIDRWISAT